MTAVAMEVRKLRRKHFWLMAAAAAGVELLWLAASLAQRAAGSGPRMLALSLNEVLALAALVMPIAAALLASRLVTADTEGRMDETWSALGQPQGTRFAAKTIVLATTLTLLQLVILAFVALVGPAAGLRITPGYRAALLPAALVLAASVLAATAAQLALSTRVPKQAVATGIAAVATIACTGLPYAGIQAAGWLLPWGLIGAAQPIDQLASQTTATHDVVLNSSPTLTALAALAVAAVWCVLARALVTRMDAHR